MFLRTESRLIFWRPVSEMVPNLRFYFFPDPRTRDWFLVGSPGVVLTILVSYLYFCTSAGPRYMKNRKPYDLKFVMMLYNVVQVVVSTWLVWEGLQAGWLYDYSYKCQPVDYSLSPNALRVRSSLQNRFTLQ